MTPIRGSRGGRLIVLEGGEASGKTTQAKTLARRLGAVHTFEPGATEVGKKIRRLVLNTVEQLDPWAEALLIAADRAQHVAETLRPALDAGRDVVCDRYVGSSLAYQGFGRGLGVEEVRQISSWATGGLDPDAVIYLDVSPDIALERLGDRDRDRFEREDAEFHRRVAYGFKRLADTEPGWVVVDGDGTRKEVEQRIARALSRVLGL